MTQAQIVAWLKTEFQPLTFATPDATLTQLVQNAFRYWSTHSAFKHVKMYPVPGENGRVQLTKEFKSVVDIFPDRTTTFIFQSHPLWTLLGITILDNVTEDLITLGEAYRAYRSYVGAELRWKFEKSDDPEIGGYLYVAGMPPKATQMYVVGTKRLYAADDVVQENTLEWILSYVKALLKQVEGNTLRKSDIIGVKNDGQQLVDEGKEEVKELQERLGKEGRWVTFARRF